MVTSVHTPRIILVLALVLLLVWENKHEGEDEHEGDFCRRLNPEPFNLKPRF